MSQQVEAMLDAIMEWETELPDRVRTVMGLSGARTTQAPARGQRADMADKIAHATALVAVTEPLDELARWLGWHGETTPGAFLHANHKRAANVGMSPDYLIETVTGVWEQVERATRQTAPASCPNHDKPAPMRVTPDGDYHCPECGQIRTPQWVAEVTRGRLRTTETPVTQTDAAHIFGIPLNRLAQWIHRGEIPTVDGNKVRPLDVYRHTLKR